jgi:methionine aminotransferase
MKPLSSITKALSQSDIRSITARVNAVDGINLGQGICDMPTPDPIKEGAKKAIDNDRSIYAPFGGIDPLKQRIVAKVESFNNIPIHGSDNILVTSGSTGGFVTATFALLDPGDEVILFEPAYDCYEPAITVNGGIPVPIELEPPEYTINWNKVEDKLSDRTRLIIINTPHNPTGTVLDQQAMEQLESLVNGTDIFVLSDEVYEHIVFDGREHQSVMRFPGLAERSFAVFSFGKVYHTTGWKIGYCMAPEPLMQEFRKVHQYEVFCTNHPLQHALADFLDNKEEYLKLNDLYQKKRDYFLELIDDSRFEYVPAGGTYFQSLNYGNISQQPDTEFADWMLKEAGVAAIPLSPFYHESVYDNVPEEQKTMLRFCFAKEDETLEKAADILCDL